MHDGRSSCRDGGRNARPAESSPHGPFACLPSLRKHRLPGTNSGVRERLFAPCVPDDFVGENPVKTAIPAFSWSGRFRCDEDDGGNAGVRGADGLDVPVKLIINHAGNALTNQHADINRTHEILADESLCEFIVGVDVVMTDSMRYADIVLPDVAQVEQASLKASGNSDGLRAAIECESWDACLHDRRPAWMSPATSPGAWVWRRRFATRDRATQNPRNSAGSKAISRNASMFPASSPKTVSFCNRSSSA